MRLRQVVVDTINSKLRRVDTGIYETAQEGVEYYSPDQHGGRYGIVYRQYHGAKTNGQTVATIGITKLVDFGGLYGTNTVYRGHNADGTNSIGVTSGVDLVTFNVVNWVIDEGWVDYVK